MDSKKVAGFSVFGTVRHSLTYPYIQFIPSEVLMSCVVMLELKQVTWQEARPHAISTAHIKSIENSCW